MPYEHKPAETVYHREEYPKMLTHKTEHGAIVPVIYPAGHEKQGQPVIFENEDEEKAYHAPKAKKSEPQRKDK